MKRREGGGGGKEQIENHRAALVGGWRREKGRGGVNTRDTSGRWESENAIVEEEQAGAFFFIQFFKVHPDK